MIALDGTPNKRTLDDDLRDPEILAMFASFLTLWNPMIWWYLIPVFLRICIEAQLSYVNDVNASTLKTIYTQRIQHVLYIENKKETSIYI